MEACNHSGSAADELNLRPACDPFFRPTETAITTVSRANSLSCPAKAPTTSNASSSPSRAQTRRPHGKDQDTNKRAFHHCLSDLLKLRAETRKVEIGFESQQRKQEEDARRENNENRKRDPHKFKVWLAECQAKYQQLANARLEIPEVRVPGRIERIKAHLQAA